MFAKNKECRWNKIMRFIDKSIVVTVEMCHHQLRCRLFSYPPHIVWLVIGVILSKIPAVSRRVAVEAENFSMRSSSESIGLSWMRHLEYSKYYFSHLLDVARPILKLGWHIWFLTVFVLPIKRLFSYPPHFLFFSNIFHF